MANARPPTPPSSSTHPRPSRRPLGYTRACFRSCVGPSLRLRVTSQPGFGHASWQGVLWPTSCQRRSQAPFGVLGRVLRRERGFPGARRARRGGGSRPRPRADSGAKGGRTRVGGARLDAGRGPCLLHRPDGVPGGAEEESTCHISSDIHSTDINSSHDSPDRPPPLIHFPCSLRCESMARGGGGGGGARALPRAVLWS